MLKSRLYETVVTLYGLAMSAMMIWMGFIQVAPSAIHLVEQKGERLEWSDRIVGGKVEASFSRYDGMDRWRIAAAGDERITVTFHSEITAGRLLFRVEDGAGTVLMQTPGNRDAAEIIDLMPGEELFLITSGEEAEGSFRYSVTKKKRLTWLPFRGEP